MSKRSILITGGARSGKSRFAQELALTLGDSVLFVATATADDEEMRQRIEAHRRARPDDWITLEVATGIAARIESEIGGARVVVIDCITLLVNNIFSQSDERVDDLLLEEKVSGEINGMVDYIGRSDASFVIVTNEVGMGLVPANKTGRVYRDLLGKANQILAQRVGEVYLMVAGLPLPVKPAGY